MFAVTERLLLRPDWPEDAPLLAGAIGDRAVARMLAHVPWPYRLEDAERWLAQPQDAARPAFLLVRRDTAELIGGLGFAGEGEPELGYWITRAQWSQVYATEAGRAAMALADHSLRYPRVRACHALDNPASAHVLTKLGLLAKGEAREIASAGRGGTVPVRSLARPRSGSTPARLAA